MKTVHPTLSLSTTKTTYYSVDGYGGHAGYQRYNWKEIRKTSTPFKNPMNGELDYYSTNDFYPTIIDWAAYSGPRHGLSYMTDARINELEFDKLCSPFISPGWHQVPDRNMRPGQWLGLLKSNMMLGAEFFYTCQFYNAGVEAPQDPRQYIWQFSTPAFAQSVFSYCDEFLFLGEIVKTKENGITTKLNLPVHEGPNFYAVVREYNLSLIHI